MDKNVEEMYERLSGIYLCRNVDGVHIAEKLIGYIDQHPFVVLRNLFTRYYIYGFGNSQLYPACLAGFKYSLFIRDEGYTNSYSNYTKNKVKNIDAFVEMFSDELSPAKCVSEFNNEYMAIIDKCIDNDGNKDLQLAIDISTGEIDLNLEKEDEDFRIRICRNYMVYEKLLNDKYMFPIEYTRSEIEQGDL